MKKLIAFTFFASQMFGATIFLDFDTPGTGSNIIGAPLVTALGTITATGAELVTSTSDLEFDAAGASGNRIDHLGGTASLGFDFDVAFISFIYGGNAGDITVNVLNSSAVIVDTFFQASTDFGQPAGPITLTGTGIRTLQWFETSGSFAPLDNITISDSAVPEPGSLLLMGFGLAGLGLIARKRSA